MLNNTLTRSPLFFVRIKEWVFLSGYFSSNSDSVAEMKFECAAT